MVRLPLYWRVQFGEHVLLAGIISKRHRARLHKCPHFLWLNWYSVPKTESQWFRIRILFNFLVNIWSVDQNVSEDKRLLLNDPETLLSQIHALEQEPQKRKSRPQRNSGFWNFNVCFWHYCRFWVIWGNLIKLLLSLVMLYEIIEDSFICDAMLMMYFLCKQTGVFTLT